MQTYNFKMNARGRFGVIRCGDVENVVELEWEMSGSPEYDMLLAPLDLRHWSSGVDIARADQHRILGQLREWLTEQGIRSDIAASRELEQSGDMCQHSGCPERAFAGSAYCAFHFDETLLR